MVTKMEVYSLEEGDTIVYLGNYYRFVDSTSAPDGTVRVLCVDEDGYNRCISVPDDFTTLWVLVDEEEYA